MWATSLTAAERRVLRLRYYGSRTRVRTLAEVARLMHMTAQEVRSIERRALHKLRTRAVAGDRDEAVDWDEV